MAGNNLLAALLIAGVLSGASFGLPLFGPPQEKGPMVERMIEGMAKDIGLTQPQKEKFLAGAKRIEEEAKIIQSKNKGIFDKIEKELLRESPDSKIIYGYMQQISQNTTLIQFKRMDQIIQLRRELTPEQKTKLEKLTEERKRRENEMFEKMERKGQRGGGPGGPEGLLMPGGPGGPDGPEGPLGHGGPEDPNNR